jgi:hypothetical protein
MVAAGNRVVELGSCVIEWAKARRRASVFTKAIPPLMLACLLGLASSAGATTWVEEFESPLPAWESDWLGANSNLENYYAADGQSNSTRGNNPDGLWISDGDGLLLGDSIVDIVFDGALASILTSLSLDVAAHVDVGIQIYDAQGDLLLDIGSIALTGGGRSDPGSYTTFSASSTSGIGGFRFIRHIQQIEGNTSIDNVVAGSATPEPGTLALVSLGMVGLGALRRTQSVRTG